jgi:hypothetical protein
MTFTKTKNSQRRLFNENGKWGEQNTSGAYSLQNVLDFYLKREDKTNVGIESG